jgi:hypothetical protein
MLLALLICVCVWGGRLVFANLMTWFEGELMFYLVYLYPFTFLLHFSSYSPKLTLLNLLY